VNSSMKRKTVLSLFTAVCLAPALLGATAWASQAQDVFNQAAGYIKDNYGGFSQSDYRNFNQRFQPQLDSACAGQGEGCAYSAAVPVVQAMIQALDDEHTFYRTPQQYQDQLRERSGQPVNAPRLGIITSDVTNSKDLLLTDVGGNSAAERAGLLRGDRLLALNGQPSSSFSQGFLVAIRAEVATGQVFMLQIKRGEQIFELAIRGEVPTTVALPTLKTIEPGIGLLRIPNFGSQRLVSTQVHALVAQAKQNNLSALVLDLRSNPGGLASEMVGVAGAFLEQTGFRSEGRSSGFSYTWNTKGFVQTGGGISLVINKPERFTGALTVLVDKNSASGSEYLAQFLQDAGRATIIGEPTAGVGNTTTLTFPLLDGSAISLTTTKSLRLDGRPMPVRVAPDILLNDDLDILAATGRDVLVEKSLELLRNKLQNSVNDFDTWPIR
jgi:carboxyl-terminal processing protease